MKRPQQKVVIYNSKEWETLITIGWITQRILEDGRCILIDLGLCKA